VGASGFLEILISPLCNEHNVFKLIQSANTHNFCFHNMTFSQNRVYSNALRSSSCANGIAYFYFDLMENHNSDLDAHAWHHNMYLVFIYSKAMSCFIPRTLVCVI